MWCHLDFLHQNPRKLCMLVPLIITNRRHLFFHFAYAEQASKNNSDRITIFLCTKEHHADHVISFVMSEFHTPTVTNLFSKE